MQKRWKSIRGCYTREINRQKSIRSGSGCVSRKSEYIYFKQLQFLQKVVAIREPEPAAATKDSADVSSPNPEDDLQKDYQVDRRKKQKTKQNTEDDKFIEAINKSIESREKSEKNFQDEDMLFLLSLVETLKRVPPHRKIATKIKIMSILDEETSTVSTENTRNFWSQPPYPPTRSNNHGYSTVRGGSEIPPSMGYNSEPSTSSHDIPSRGYRHGYSTRRGQPEIPSMDYAESPNAPTNISDESSILDIYDYQ